ncbi:FAD-dependent oxidoreductase [Brevundimonas lenta]|uniref:Glycine oxidase n=1 Tax=Brevundimonas lenta TaxID=424796 RepID=A0A7W6JCI2_9CAUL|nr:glycine oxidase [Brevundimonas lenta]
MSSPDVIVIGAGVLGLCTAAELGARGHAVTVLDPGGPNASSAAAGMIAPALESLLDDLSPGHSALLKRARDLWPAFAARHGLTLHLEGAEWRGPDPDAGIARLHALGFAAERTAAGLLTPDDWRVEVAAAMAGLSAATGVLRQVATVSTIDRTGDSWRVTAEDGRAWSAPVIILATGAAAPLPGLTGGTTALINRIEPIRGQLTPVRCASPARVVRAPGVYAVPSEEGALFGATMEPGVRDLSVDADVSTRQQAAGLSLLDHQGEGLPARVGIRGSTPDGLPMAGASREPGLHLALAPRRNGWLLGPLVARIVADGIEGRAPVDDAATLDPLRFA